MAGTPYSSDNPPVGEMNVPSATITVGDSPPDQTTQFLSTTPYFDYFIQNEYDGNEQTIQLPVASPNGFNGMSCSFVQLAAPTLRWICDWTAKGTDGPPPAPPMQAADPNWVLLYKKIEPGTIMLMADGQTSVYRLSGRYVYGHKNPPAAINQVASFARPPWIADTFDRSVPSSIFQAGLADTSSAGQSSSSSTGASPGNPGKPPPSGPSGFLAD